ncbi:MAG: hypothetical protein H8E90_08680 [Anaerolineales bacterium]|nr:hypothetical protein [Anaerolineales bacterium]
MLDRLGDCDIILVLDGGHVAVWLERSVWKRRSLFVLSFELVIHPRADYQYDGVEHDHGD